MAVWLTGSVTTVSRNIERNTTTVNVNIVVHWNSTHWNRYGCPTTVNISDGTPATITLKPELNPSRRSSGSDTIVSRQVEIRHNTSGTGSTRITASMATDTMAGTVSWDSGNISLASIPRRELFTCSKHTVALDEQFKVTVTPLANMGSITRSITLSIGGYEVTYESKRGKTEFDVSFKASDFRARMLNQTSMIGTVEITTYYNGNWIGSNKDTLTVLYQNSSGGGSGGIVIVDTKPYIGDVTAKPADDKLSQQAKTLLIGSSSDSGADKKSFLQNVSSANLTVNASGQNGATITRVKVDFDGQTYYGSSVVTDKIKTSGRVPILVTVYDNRGSSNQYTSYINVEPYHIPRITSKPIEYTLTDGDTGYKRCSIKIGYECSSINGKNKVRAQLMYLAEGKDKWVPDKFLTDFTKDSYESLIAKLDKKKNYRVGYKVSDLFGGTMIASGWILDGTSIIEVSSNGKNVGILAPASNDKNEVTVGKKLNVLGDLYVNNRNLTEYFNGVATRDTVYTKAEVDSKIKGIKIPEVPEIPTPVVRTTSVKMKKDGDHFSDETNTWTYIKFPGGVCIAFATIMKSYSASSSIALIGYPYFIRNAVISCTPSYNSNDGILTTTIQKRDDVGNYFNIYVRKANGDLCRSANTGLHCMIIGTYS